MKTYASLLLLLFSIICIGCKTDNEKKNNIDISTHQIETIADTNKNSKATKKEYEASDDDLQEYGIIENIEDGAYPFFVITVNFVERKMKADFNLNIEAISLDVEHLNRLKGEYATIIYTSELENNLSDLHYEGVSLFGEYAPEYDSDWKQITGILSGANEVTPGDLPGMISVTDNEGKKMDFELFIDPKTVKANGKTVTAFYTINGVNTITHIRSSGE